MDSIHNFSLWYITFIRLLEWLETHVIIIAFIHQENHWHQRARRLCHRCLMHSRHLDCQIIIIVTLTNWNSNTSQLFYTIQFIFSTTFKWHKCNSTSVSLWHSSVPFYYVTVELILVWHSSGSISLWHSSVPFYYVTVGLLLVWHSSGSVSVRQSSVSFYYVTVELCLVWHSSGSVSVLHSSAW